MVKFIWFAVSGAVINSGAGFFESHFTRSEGSTVVKLWVSHRKVSNEHSEFPDTYVIFICDFDPVGAELYRYSREMVCRETGTTLGDGIYTIYLSTKGKNKDEVPSELVSFLEYVGNPAMKEKTDPFVRSLETQISTIKRNWEWRNKYVLTCVQTMTVRT
ncbi:MAG: hypothetical protein LUH58_05410 [Lachnospiraceae bacterium]|nr:hypothetical protein [Lachnospiraceae bacterium]